MQILHQGSSLHEVAQRTGIVYRKATTHRLHLLRTKSLLQADQVDAFEFCKWLKVLERDRSLPVALVFRISLPGDADAEAVEMRELLAPGFDEVLRCRKVWNVRRDVGEVDLKQPGQIEKSRIAVKRRKRRAIGKQRIDAGAGFEQTKERRRTAEHHACTALLQHGGES